MPSATPICFRHGPLLDHSSRAPRMAGHVISWPYPSATTSVAGRPLPLQNKKHNPHIFPKTPLTTGDLLRSLHISNRSPCPLQFIPYIILHLSLCLCFTYLFLSCITDTYWARFTAEIVPVSTAPPPAFEGIKY